MSATALFRPVPTIGQSPRRFVVSRHQVVDHAELQHTIPATFAALYAQIAESGVAPAGPPFVVYHDESERGVRWSIDVCAPVAAPITPTAEIQFKDMPQERIVSLMHFGPYDGLGTAYEAIDRFVREKGLVPAGPPREFYFSEPDVPPEKTQTLIEQPIL